MIHNTSIIESKNIGEGTNIWAFSHISKGASIGKNCTIGEGVHIGPNVVIGDNCKIQNHALIYEGVKIGNNVFIGPNVVTTNDLHPRALGKWDIVNTEIQDFVSIGANSTILCGIKLEEGCMVAAGSVVVKDVPTYSLVLGNPACYVKKIDRRYE
tara:strand:- start:1725 stop:2189 length:465 start_codon:yes stop_codon:yes gene_type:complete